MEDELANCWLADARNSIFLIKMIGKQLNMFSR
mgnify:CR=1 FL=1